MTMKSICMNAANFDSLKYVTPFGVRIPPFIVTQDFPQMRVVRKVLVLSYEGEDLLVLALTSAKVLRDGSRADGLFWGGWFEGKPTGTPRSRWRNESDSVKQKGKPMFLLVLKAGCV